MLTTTQPAAYIISTLLEEWGVRDVTICPGTRNAPLILALSRQKNLRLTSIVDERTAGFTALGTAIRTGRPVVVVCTSGTALLNLSPAVAEAYYRNVPLIVISADRPLKWIDQDEGQTIRQYGALANFVKRSYDIPSDFDVADFDWTVNRIVNEAMILSTDRCPGPVHINVHLDNPLWETRHIEPNNLQKRKIELVKPRALFSHAEIKRYGIGLINKKIAIIVGTQVPDAKLNRALKRFADNTEVVIFAEAQSNIKGVRCVTAIDAVVSTLTNEERNKYAPDVVISIGGGLVSQPLKQFLREREELEHWYIGHTPDDSLIDCFQHLTVKVEAESAPFLNSLASHLKKRSNPSDFSTFWLERYDRVAELTRKYTEKTSWSDFKAVRLFFENIPVKSNVQISNGMSIRYAQLSDYGRVHRIDCNRGCNGIDGSTSTAIGASIDCQHPTVLLTGDMSLKYDSGALSLPCIPNNFTLFVLKNNGGDIFRIISTTKDLDEREEYMSIPGEYDFKGLAETFGFEYFYVNDTASLIKACNESGKDSSRPKFVEIDTGDENNSEIYKDYFKFLKENI